MILASFTLDLAVPIVIFFTLVFSCGSRNAAKKFTLRRWENIVSKDYKDLSLARRYRDTALSTVREGLPHGLAVFVLFFILYWIGEPSLLSSESGLAFFVFALVVYILYKLGIYLRVQQEEASDW